MDDEVETAECELHGITATIQSHVVDRVNVKLDEVFTGITLKDLEEDYLKNSMYEEGMYYI